MQAASKQDAWSWCVRPTSGSVHRARVQVMYPALAAVLGELTPEHQLREHQQLKEGLGRLDASSVADPNFDGMLQDVVEVQAAACSSRRCACACALADGSHAQTFTRIPAPCAQVLLHHMAEEEQDVLPRFAAATSSEHLMQLGRAFEAAKLLAPSRPHSECTQPEGVAAASACVQSVRVLTCAATPRAAAAAASPQPGRPTSRRSTSSPTRRLPALISCATWCALAARHRCERCCRWTGGARQRLAGVALSCVSALLQWLLGFRTTDHAIHRHCRPQITRIVSPMQTRQHSPARSPRPCLSHDLLRLGGARRRACCSSGRGGGGAWRAAATIADRSHLLNLDLLPGNGAAAVPA